MPKRNNAGSKRTRRASRAKQPQHLSWPGRVARKIKSGIKKLVG